MTFYFGFAAKGRCYLAVDRRRTDEFGNIDDATSKLVRINRSTFLAGAGLMHFLDYVGNHSAKAFGASKPSWPELERVSQRWASQLSVAFSQMVDAAPNLGPTTNAHLQFCGMTSDCGPYSFTWSSETGFENLGRGPFRFYLPIFKGGMDSDELVNRICNVVELAEKGRGRARILVTIADLFAWIAATNDAVSELADVAIIGRWRSRIFNVGT